MPGLASSTLHGTQTPNCHSHEGTPTPAGLGLGREEARDSSSEGFGVISSIVQFSSLLTFVFSMPGRTDFAAVFRLSCPALSPGFVSKLSVSYYHPYRKLRKLLEMNKKEMERVKGIEPSLQAWEARVLPLNHTRTVTYALIRLNRRFCKPRVEQPRVERENRRPVVEATEPAVMVPRHRSGSFVAARCVSQWSAEMLNLVEQDLDTLLAPVARPTACLLAEAVQKVLLVGQLSPDLGKVGCHGVANAHHYTVTVGFELLQEIRRVGVMEEARCRQYTYLEFEVWQFLGGDGIKPAVGGGRAPGTLQEDLTERFVWKDVSDTSP